MIVLKVAVSVLAGGTSLYIFGSAIRLSLRDRDMEPLVFGCCCAAMPLLPLALMWFGSK